MQFANLALLAATAAATVNAASNFTSTSVYVQAVISPVSALSSVNATSTSPDSQITGISGSGSNSGSGSGSGSGSNSGSGSGSDSGSGSTNDAAAATAGSSGANDGGLSLLSVGKAPSFSTSVVVVSHQTTELITITSCSEHVCTKVPTLTTYYASSSYTSYIPALSSALSSASVAGETSSQLQPAVTVNENSAPNVVPAGFSIVNAGTAALSVIALVWIL